MGTDPQLVAHQADKVASAWSPADAPLSWELTAAQFRTLRDDHDLLAIAATIPPGKLPPLLFTAAATFLVLELAPRRLRDSFPQLGEAQPPLARHFARHYREFCLDHRERLLEVCACHRYQMNEVGRCAQLLPALAPEIADGREIVLIDVGTGAGLALQMDRYRYLFHGPGRQLQSVGDPYSNVVIETTVRGQLPVPVPPTVPRVVERIGIDVEPLDLGDRGVRSWLAACTPQEIGAVTRFHCGVEVAIAHPAMRVRGDACDVLAGVVEQASEAALVCVIDAYVHVFFSAPQLRRFHALVEELGARRDLDWVSIDPLVPMGEDARDSVQGIPVPAALLQRNRREGVFGVVSRLRYREGRRSAALLGVAHPGAAWLEWLAG